MIEFTRYPNRNHAIANIDIPSRPENEKASRQLIEMVEN
jgi:hypothetical protein